VRSLAFPASAKSTVIVVPAVGPLHHPTSWPSPRTADKWRLAPSADVGTHPTLARLELAVGIVVALVQAEVGWPARAPRREHQHGIERRTDHPFVVDVGSRERHRDGDASAVGQNVTFCAALSTIGRIGTREVPPFGAFTMAPSSEAHSQSMPRSTW